MKGKIKTIAGVLLIILGFLTYLFFRNYSGHLIPYPVVWNFAGILLLIAGSLLINSGLTRRDKADDKKYAAEIDSFKLTADKIKVDLNSCEIRSNSYSQQISKAKDSRSMLLDAMVEPNLNIQNIEINQAVLVFETDILGQREQYISATIYKDPATLSFLLDKQKETCIYVDRDNRSNYYFDLEFLSV